MNRPLVHQRAPPLYVEIQPAAKVDPRQWENEITHFTYEICGGPGCEPSTELPSEESTFFRTNSSAAGDSPHQLTIAR